MKKLAVLTLLLCSLQAMAQPWEKVEGNGNLKKETRTVGSYNALASSGSWDVRVSYGSSNTIEVEGDENLLPYIETVVEGNTLQIKAKNKSNLRSKRKVTVYVSLTKVTAVALSGSGDISGNGNFSNDGNTDVKLSGSGNIKFAFEQFKSLEVSISGSGNVVLEGKANTVNARISGSGNADCSGVTAEDATGKISGSGNIKINANKSIDASISGSGNVYYKGSATDVRTHKAGSGRVVKA